MILVRIFQFFMRDNKLNKDVIDIIMRYISVYIVKYNDGTVTYDDNNIIEYDRKKHAQLVSIIPTTPNQRFYLHHVTTFRGCKNLTTLPTYVECVGWKYNNLLEGCCRLKGILRWRIHSGCELDNALIGMEPRMILRTFINLQQENGGNRHWPSLVGMLIIPNLDKLSNNPNTSQDMKLRN